jgi:hypothetical protein
MSRHRCALGEFLPTCILRDYYADIFREIFISMGIYPGDFCETGHALSVSIIYSHMNRLAIVMTNSSNYKADDLFLPRSKQGRRQYFERGSLSPKSRIFTVNFKDICLCSGISRSISKICPIYTPTPCRN